MLVKSGPQRKTNECRKEDRWLNPSALQGDVRTLCDLFGSEA
jgi:hypothetical protein